MVGAGLGTLLTLDVVAIVSAAVFAMISPALAVALMAKAVAMHMATTMAPQHSA